MKFFQLLFLGVILVACGSESSQSTAHGHDAPMPTTISAEDVLKDLRKHDGDLSAQEKVLKSALDENFDAGLDEKAVFIYRNAQYNFDDESHIQSYAPIFLEASNEHADVENFRRGIESAFVTKYPQHPYAARLKTEKTISTVIDQKAEMINNNNFNRFSVPDAKDYIELSEAYSLIYPRDESAGSQLIKAGNTAKSINGYGAKAVMIYDWLLEKQPNHPKAGQALFLKAFTYDNELAKPEMAKKYYTEFLEKYPDDDFADEAQILLENVGKTDEEFYETIVNKKGEK